MSIAIDLLGTNLGSGTRTYNINFCKNLQNVNLKENIYIFLSENYFKEINFLTNNPKITLIVKSNLFSNIFFRLFWMQFLLPLNLKIRGINKLFSPMNICPIFNIFNIKIILGLHSNLPWLYFNLMPGSFWKKYLTKKIMELSIHRCNSIIIPSNFAKKETSKIFKIKKKIHVINHGLEVKNYKKKTYGYSLKSLNNKKYILSVLSCVKYHNIINLLKAYKSFIKKKKLI